MEPNKDVFQYTYSAKQQEEIEAIRKKYLPPRQLSPLWWAWRAVC